MAHARQSLLAAAQRKRNTRSSLSLGPRGGPGQDAGMACPPIGADTPGEEGPLSAFLFLFRQGGMAGASWGIRPKSGMGGLECDWPRQLSDSVSPLRRASVE